MTATTASPGTAAVAAPPAVRERGGRHAMAAVAGLALALLSLSVPFPEVPEVLTAESVRVYLTDNAAGLRLFGFSLAGCAVLLLVFVAQLRALMPRTYLADVAYGSGLLCSVWMLVSAGFHAVSALDGIDGAPDEIVLQYLGLMTVGDSIGSASTYAKGALMLAVGLAALRTRFLPRWLGWLSVLLGAMAIGGGLGFVENPVTGALWYGGLIGFAVWPLPVAVTLIVQAVRDRRA